MEKIVGSQVEVLVAASDHRKGRENLLESWILQFLLELKFLAKACNAQHAQQLAQAVCDPHAERRNGSVWLPCRELHFDIPDVGFVPSSQELLPVDQELLVAREVCQRMETGDEMSWLLIVSITHHISPLPASILGLPAVVEGFKRQEHLIDRLSRGQPRDQIGGHVGDRDHVVLNDLTLKEDLHAGKAPAFAMACVSPNFSSKCCPKFLDATTSCCSANLP